MNAFESFAGALRESSPDISPHIAWRHAPAPKILILFPRFTYLTMIYSCLSFICQVEWKGVSYIMRGMDNHFDSSPPPPPKEVKRPETPPITRSDIHSFLELQRFFSDLTDTQAVADFGMPKKNLERFTLSIAREFRGDHRTIELQGRSPLLTALIYGITSAKAERFEARVKEGDSQPNLLNAGDLDELIDFFVRYKSDWPDIGVEEKTYHSNEIADIIGAVVKGVAPVAIIPIGLDIRKRVIELAPWLAPKRNGSFTPLPASIDPS